LKSHNISKFAKKICRTGKKNEFAILNIKRSWGLPMRRIRGFMKFKYFSTKQLSLFVLFTSNLLLFQNCSPAFHMAPLSQSSLSGLSLDQPLKIDSPAASSYIINDSATIAGPCNEGVLVEISGDITTPLSAMCLNKAFSQAVQFSNPDGLKNVRVQQSDTLGNVIVDSRSFQRDTTPPALSLMTPAQSATTNGQVMVQGLCEIGGTVAVRQGTGTPTNVSCSATGMFSTLMSLSGADGTVQISVAQYDAAGNVSQVARNITKDTVAPAPTITQPAANSTVQNGFTLSGTCESGFMVEIAGAGTTSPISVACSAGAFSGVVSLTSGNGSKAVTISQTDAVGNKGSANRSFSRMDAANAPVINITAPAADTATKNNIALQGTCTTGLNVTINGSGVKTPATVACNNGAFSASVALSSGDGTKNVVTTQTNSSGTSGISSRNFVLDTTAPALVLTSPAANSAVKTSVTLIGTCESGLAIAISGAGAAAAVNASCTNGAFSQAVNLSSGDGAKAFSLSQTDAVGNVATVTRSFNRDTTAPAVTIASPAADTSAATGVTVTGACEGTFTVTASGSGLSAPVSAACASSAYSLNVIFSAGDGTKAVTISQTDAAGNVGSVSRNFVRTTVPVLDGAALYAQNCAACHSALATSAKLGRTASQISAAIGSIPQMSTLKTLTSAQISAIASALAGGGGGPVQSKFTCDPNLDPSPSRMERLAKREYVQTLNDLFGATVNVTTLVKDDIAAVPEEAPGKTYDTFDLATTDGHVNAYYGVADSLSTKIVANTTYLTAIGTSCLSQTAPTSTCVDNFIANFGLKAFRRPLLAAEKTRYRSLYDTYTAQDGAKTGVRLLLLAFLSSPNFLYHLEDQGTLVSGRTDLYKITPYELASRISYMATGSMPDAAMLTAAGDGSLNTDAGIATQLQRLISAGSVRAKAREFVAEWLRITPAPPTDYPAAYVTGLQDMPNLRSAMVQDLNDYVDYIFWTAKGNYKTLMTSNVAIVRSMDMAKIYGISSATGQPVSIDPTKRGGLLTRPVFLHAGNTSNNPFHRGATILRRILCNNIPAPDPNSLPDGALTPPAFDPNKTTRERFTAKTSPSSCIGCHSVINPIGFSLEAFDSIGRFRTSESIFDSSQKLVNTLPIDPTGIVSIDGTQRNVENGIAMSVQIAGSYQGPSCFIEQFDQFVTGDAPAASDGCKLLRMEQALNATDGSIEKMFNASIIGPEIRLRKVKP
jgi:hypothetical protein